MSDKAFNAFKHILENPGGIVDVQATGSEYYFKYKGHIFSVLKREDEEDGTVLSAFVYPNYSGSVSGLINYYDEGQPYDEIPMVRYGTDQLENRHFGTILGKLYKIVGDKYLNLDTIFDDIVSP